MTNILETATLRADQSFVDLAFALESAVTRRFAYYCPSPGNWGDGLINLGTEQFFSDTGIRPFALRRDQLNRKIQEHTTPYPTDESLLIVGGGGGWCEAWHSTQEFVELMSGFFAKIIVLPTTYDLSPIESRGAEITYFARDRLVSLDAVPQAQFCHDMAFYISRQFVTEGEVLPRLVSLRNDREKNPKAKSFWNSIDISSLGNSYQEVDSFFSVIAHFEHVVTDRLHVAIAASLVGRSAQILPGNYRKALGVWEASINGNYPNCEFVEWDHFDFYKK